MEVWAVLYKPEVFSEDLYQSALRILDPESSARIRRFYHREDACREHDPSIALHDTTPGLDPLIAYNISHDNGLIVMAFGPGIHNPPAFNIGVDVMKVRIPDRNTLASFVERISQIETLKRFFWLWTMKEAYTKALGLGLGFDFSRIEYDIGENIVRVDNRIALGWRFTKFVLTDENDLYQGVVAEYIGGATTEIINETQNCVLSWGAVPFVATVLHELDDA
ncbi:hypothetical protein C0995_000897 [Termitomyces sp. Mi166|nr:hypothetical protein C0995_000897 [Termitomyces sp. Mi166\